jgi:hypothetical protein
MNRREVLASIGTLGTVATAGCSGGGSKAPVLKRVELLSDWREGGDVDDNAIGSVRQGAVPYIGLLYEYYHEDGEEASRAQVDITHEGQGAVGVLEDRTQRLVDFNNEWAEWEWALTFNTTGVPVGGYEATALVRDTETGKTSESVSTTFTITN